MRSLKCAVVFLVVLLFAGCDWFEKGEGTKEWKYKGASGPIAISTDGAIYASGSWFIHAIDKDGKLIWISKDTLYSPVIGSDGTIYANHYFSLYAISPADGSTLWEYETDGGVTTPALGSDGTVYFCSAGKYLYALDPDGTLKWRVEPQAISSGLPDPPSVGADGTIYVGERCIWAYNPDSTLKWITCEFLNGNPYLPVPWASARTQPAIGSDGTIYSGSSDGLYAVNTDGSLKWHYTYIRDIRHSPVIGESGTIYVCDVDNCLYAINPDGTKKWAYETDDRITTSAVIDVDETIYVGTEGGFVYAIKYDGSLRWTFDVKSKDNEARISSIALGEDSTIYAGAGEYLFAIRCAAGLASSPWPMEGHDPQRTGRTE